MLWLIKSLQLPQFLLSSDIGYFNINNKLRSKMNRATQMFGLENFLLESYSYNAARNNGNELKKCKILMQTVYSQFEKFLSNSSIPWINNSIAYLLCVGKSF